MSNRKRLSLGELCRDLGVPYGRAKLQLWRGVITIPEYPNGGKWMLLSPESEAKLRRFYALCEEGYRTEVARARVFGKNGR